MKTYCNWVSFTQKSLCLHSFSLPLKFLQPEFLTSLQLPVYICFTISRGILFNTTTILLNFNIIEMSIFHSTFQQLSHFYKLLTRHFKFYLVICSVFTSQQVKTKLNSHLQNISDNLFPRSFLFFLLRLTPFIQKTSAAL